jgi:hypothetical protein
MHTKLAATALLASLALGGVALAPAASAASAPMGHTSATVAPALTPAFNAGGVWPLYQSNGAVVTMNVVQDPAGTLYGTATFGSTVGTIQSGAADGTSIYFTIGWSNRSLGRYTGNLGPDRRLSGYTFDINHPSSQATWHTNRTF